MPLKTPNSSSKSGGKSKGKAVTPARGKGENKPAPKKKTAPISRSPEPAYLSWWENLTPERKLDVVGAIMAVAGLLILLILFSAQRSALTGNMIRLLRQFIGWGVYILPVALILMGLWLILRRIEKLPPPFPGACYRDHHVFRVVIGSHAFHYCCARYGRAGCH